MQQTMGNLLQPDSEEPENVTIAEPAEPARQFSQPEQPDMQQPAEEQSAPADGGPEEKVSFYDPQELNPDPLAEQEPQDAGEEKTYNPAYEFAAKTLEKRRLEAQVNTLKAELNQLQPEVIDQLNELNMTRMTTTLGATVHLRNDARPSLIPDEDGTKTSALQALREHDLDYLIGVNAQTLRGYVNEQKKMKKEIPPGVAQFIHIDEQPVVSVRAS